MKIVLTDKESMRTGNQGIPNAVNKWVFYIPAGLLVGASAILVGQGIYRQSTLPGGVSQVKFDAESPCKEPKKPKKTPEKKVLMKQQTALPSHEAETEEPTEPDIETRTPQDTPTILEEEQEPTPDQEITEIVKNEKYSDIDKLFETKSRTHLTEKDMVFGLSLDMRLHTPKEAQQLINGALEDGYLIEEGGKLRRANT